MKHPAAAMPFDDLLRELRARKGAGLVKETVAPDDDRLSLFCYTQRAVFEKAWDVVVEAARGIVLDLDRRVVVAYAFPKFFNFGERSADIPDEPFETFEKLDGSLGVIFHDGRRWRVTTKGSFTAAQAEWAHAWIEQHAGFAALPVGVTLLVEIVYDANRIVVRYPFSGLVLLAAYDSGGEELSRSECEEIATRAALRMSPKHDYASVEAMQAAVAGFASDREGFVIRFASGYRLKLKGAEYLRIHRLVSNVTPLAIWDVLANGGDVAVIRKEIPEEFWGDFDTIARLLKDSYQRVIDDTDDARVEFMGATNKDVGLALPRITEPARHFIFAARKKGARWFDDPKTRQAVFRWFRPDGNVLPGYEPSVSMLRTQEEMQG